MKLKATILTCCLLVYLLELAAMPVLCGVTIQQENTSTPKNDGKCTGKQQRSCTKKMTDSPCKKTSKPYSKNATDCCINNCPLFYLMTIHEATMPDKISSDSKRTYAHYQSNYLFIYYSTSWKPPNGC